MRVLLWGSLLFAAQAWAADWQFLGASDAGAYYADRHSLQWQGERPIFDIATNVIEKNKVEWQTVIRIDCGNSTFTYLSGAKVEGGKSSLRFDTPRSTEKILPGTMPDLLKTEYCGTYPTDHSKVVRWEPAGKSNVANVYFERASLQKNKDGFVIDTKVVPFHHEEETYGTVAFSCKDDTFTMLKLARLKDGKLEKVFDKPQPPLATSKMATLAIVADKFCGKSKTASAATKTDACIQVLGSMRSLEAQIQRDADNGGLACDQVPDYLQQVSDISKATARHDCGISGLEAYAQQLKSADCVR